MTLAFRKINEDAKAKTPILFIHGAMSSNLVWILLARELAKSVTEKPMYLIDLPGHGESDGEPKEQIEKYAAAVIGFMDELDIDQATLVGHSMGGAISQQLAIDHPDRVEKLALLATGARLGVSPQILEGLRNQFDTATDMVGDFLFGPGADPAIVKTSMKLIKDAGPKTAIADFTACNGFDSVGKIDNLEIPAIVICGDKDLMTSAKKNRRLAQSIGCPYFELEGIGHMLQLEETKKTAGILADFLTGE